MKHNLHFLKQSLTLLLLVIFAPLYAQVGVNTTTPHPSAALDIKSDTAGVLIPRVDKTSRQNIANPANSLLVYDTDYKMFFYYQNGQWFALNTFTTTATPNVGTTDTVSYTHGKVGIGIQNPAERLHVLGNVKVNGAFTSTGNISTTGNLSAMGGTFTAAVSCPSFTTGNIVCNNVTMANMNATGTVTANVFHGQGTIPVGTVLMWSGSVAANFNASGLGTGSMTGYALCNGNNGTPDLRGRFIVGYNPALADYDVIGDVGGEEKHTLSMAEMPAHNHSFDIAEFFSDETESGTSGGGFQVGGGWTTITTNTRGNSQPHENRPPYYVLAYIYKLPY